MKIMVLGSGGREHALAWKLAQSKEVEQVYVAPGNPGTARFATNLPVTLSALEEVVALLVQYRPQIVVVGPEDPLVHGLKERCAAHELLKDMVFVGPGRDGARLEGSKDFAKQFMVRHGIPTAAYRTFTAEEYPQACAFLATLKAPYVLKANGLAAGKGVIISPTLEAAQEDLKELLGGKFGEAGSKVVIEEYLHGIEVSVFVLTDGLHYKILPHAKDYKRIGEGDQGLNTGGMGAVSPVAFANEAFMQKVEDRIIQPTLKGLAQEGMDYRGFLFLGLMNCQGDPYVIEYNVRMGDPETEAVMLRLQGDLAAACAALGTQTLDRVPLTCNPQSVVTVVATSGGYPGAYEKGQPITEVPAAETGTDATTPAPECEWFHMGTARRNGALVTSGGRVLAVSALGATTAQARQRAYQCMERLSFSGMYYRRDIGLDVMAYERDSKA